MLKKSIKIFSILATVTIYTLYYLNKLAFEIEH